MAVSGSLNGTAQRMIGVHRGGILHFPLQVIQFRGVGVEQPACQVAFLFESPFPVHPPPRRSLGCEHKFAGSLSAYASRFSTERSYLEQMYQDCTGKSSKIQVQIR